LRPAYGWCALEQPTVLTTHSQLGVEQREVSAPAAVDVAERCLLMRSRAEAYSSDAPGLVSEADLSHTCRRGGILPRTLR
jgi:hypothetical protein